MLGGAQLPVRMQTMRRIIRMNGHLIMDGTETKEELTEAIISLLVDHTSDRCHSPESYIPIERLTSEDALLAKELRKPRNVTVVDISGESL